MTKIKCILLPRTFVENGGTIMGSDGENSRSFTSWFGTKSQVCSMIWNLCPRSNIHNGKPFHLL